MRAKLVEEDGSIVRRYFGVIVVEEVGKIVWEEDGTRVVEEVRSWISRELRSCIGGGGNFLSDKNCRVWWTEQYWGTTGKYF